jgi:hypothetical protein
MVVESIKHARNQASRQEHQMMTTLALDFAGYSALFHWMLASVGWASMDCCMSRVSVAELLAPSRCAHALTGPFCLEQTRQMTAGPWVRWFRC